MQTKSKKMKKKHIRASHKTFEKRLYGVFLLMLIVVLVTAVFLGALCNTEGNRKKPPSKEKLSFHFTSGPPHHPQTVSTTINDRMRAGCFLNYEE